MTGENSNITRLLSQILNGVSQQRIRQVQCKQKTFQSVLQPHQAKKPHRHQTVPFPPASSRAVPTQGQHCGYQGPEQLPAVGRITEELANGKIAGDRGQS